MLSFMPQSPPPPQPAHASMSDTTMSLAILPSAPMSYSQPSAPTLLSPSPAKRPKLSLDTNNVTTIFGKSSTSLRLDSASSPTARNTFRNTFEPPGRTSGSRSKPALKQLSTNLPTTGETVAPAAEATPLIQSASSSASISSSSTVDSLPERVPYKLSYSITSILVNSPIARSRPRNSMFAPSKPMFPAAKRVSFKSPLEEEVKNVVFTMRHSDIESSTSTISTLELSPPESIEKTTVNCNQNESHTSTAQETSSPQTGDKRESSDEEDSDSTPQTPGPSGRRKRHRQWVWTLGPINQPTREPDPEPPETSSMDDESEKTAGS